MKLWDIGEMAAKFEVNDLEQKPCSAVALLAISVDPQVLPMSLPHKN